MHFLPSQRISSRLNLAPSQASLAQMQLLPVYVANRRRQHRQYLRCGFDGFYEPETVQEGRYVWTGPRAAVECHFPVTTSVQYIWLEIGHTAPRGSVIQVRVNGELLLANHELIGRKTVEICLGAPRKVTHMTLGLESTTFLPQSSLPGSQDTRQLGISLRGIVFGKRRAAYRGHLGVLTDLPRLLPRWIHQWMPARAA